MPIKLTLPVSMVLALSLVGVTSAELLLRYGFDEASGNIAIDSTGGNDGTISGGTC